MAAAKGAAAPAKKGAAARGETNGKAEIEFEYLGVTLKAPPKLPPSFALRFTRIVATEERGEYAGGAAYELAARVLGDEQMDAVIAASDDLPDTEDGPTVVDLLIALVGAYGQAAGESEASAGS